MSSLKRFKLAEKSMARQHEVITGLNTLVKDIERSEQMITELKSELDAVNFKHKDRQTTREDIAYLQDLLKCANKKLAWEKRIAGLQKRTPLILEEVSSLMNDPKNPPDGQVRAEILGVLQSVQTAMERLQNVKV